MTWKDQIAGSFGFGIAPFAANRLDQDRAREAIKTAKAEGASREEFAKAIALYACKYNKNENAQRERIKRDGDIRQALENWSCPPPRRSWKDRMIDDVDGLDGEVKYITSLLDQVRGKLGDRFLRIELADHLTPEEHAIQSAVGVGRGHRQANRASRTGRPASPSRHSRRQQRRA